MITSTITRRELDALLDMLNLGPDDVIEFFSSSAFYDKTDPEAQAVHVAKGDVGAGHHSVFVRKVS